MPFIDYHNQLDVKLLNSDLYHTHFVSWKLQVRIESCHFSLHQALQVTN